MLEISIKQMKNCITELGSTEREVRKAITRLENVYSNFDSLVEGKLDKQILRAVIDEVSIELRSTIGMRKALEQIVQQYETTEKKVLSTAIARVDKSDFGFVDLRSISRALDSLGVAFD